MFPKTTVRELRDDDFDLDTELRITLKDKNCNVILFYAKGKESEDLGKVWLAVSNQVVGVTISACDLYENKKIAKAMSDIRSSGGHPLHWASLRGYPFILSYRNGYPVAFYNGDRYVDPITNWVMTKACLANYYEPYDSSGGVSTENKEGIPKASNYKSKGNSDEFTVNSPVRTYGTQGVQGAPGAQGTPGGAQGGAPGTPGGAQGAQGTQGGGPRAVGPT